jgi:hypothetical protein
MMARRVQNILENAAFDPERLVAPRGVWFDNEELDKWYDSRMELRKNAGHN